MYMKTTFEIARIQLARLFYSPIAWLILIVLLIQTGYALTDRIGFFEEQQRKNFPWSLLTWNIYTSSRSSNSGIFYNLSQNLYLYLPLLTMGLLSAERSSGSIKLLFSSPVTTLQLITGKFLSMVSISFLLITSLWLFVISGIFIIQDLDLPSILSASIGVFLLSCAYTSIGLFISSLSAYQIVVAITTFVALTALNFVGNLGQDIPYLKEVTFWLSMPDRAKDFIDGLFKSQNLIYFLLIITLFLTMTMLSMEFSRRPASRLVQTGSYVSVLVVTLFIGYMSSKPSLRWYYDMTIRDSNTISKNSQDVIKSMSEGPLVMKVFVNILDHNMYSGLPYNQNRDKRVFEDFQRFKSDLTFEYIYFYDTVDHRSLFEDNKSLSIKQLAEKLAKSYGLAFEEVLSPSEIKQIVDLSEEENQYVRQLTYNGKSTFLRMFDGIAHYPTEEHITAALKNLINDQPMTVAFLTGHNERNFRTNRDEDYKMAFDFRHQKPQSLRNLGLDFMNLSLLKEEIPDHINIIVIADPRTTLAEKELNKIQKYIDGGGNLLIAIEPDMAFTLQPLLEKLQVTQIPGQLTADNEDYDETLISAHYYADDTTLFPNPWQNKYILKYKYPVTMPGVSGWTYDSTGSDFTITPFTVAENAMSDSLNIPYNVIPTILTLRRKISGREQRILVAGDADFMSNREMTRRNITSNNRRGLVPSIFHWLSNNELPVNVEKPLGNDNYLRLAEKHGRTVAWLKIIYMGLLPGLLFTGGATLLIYRRRK